MTTGKFEYINPRTIYYGEGSLRSGLESELRAVSAERVHIVTTASLLESATLAYLRSVSHMLTDASLSTVSSHTPVEEVYQAACDIEASKADVIVALGGGSVSDASKLAAHGTGSASPQSMSVEDFEKLVVTGGGNSLPTVGVPTTLSVAELCGAAGFSELGTKRKVGTYFDYLIPKAVFFDPVVTDDTPDKLWLSTGIRAVDHAVESLVSDDINPISEQLALSSLVRLTRNLRLFSTTTTSRSVRHECQIGAWESYSLPRQSGKGLSHALGKAIGSIQAIPHGVTSCLLLPHVIRFYSLNPQSARRLAPAAAAIGAPTSMNDAQSVQFLAAEIGSLISQAGLPTSLDAYGVPSAVLDASAESVSDRTGFDLISVRAIYEAAR